MYISDCVHLIIGLDLIRLSKAVDLQSDPSRNLRLIDWGDWSITVVKKDECDKNDCGGVHESALDGCLSARFIGCNCAAHHCQTRGFLRSAGTTSVHLRLHINDYSDITTSKTVSRPRTRQTNWKTVFQCSVDFWLCGNLTLKTLKHSSSNLGTWRTRSLKVDI